MFPTCCGYQLQNLQFMEFVPLKDLKQSYPHTFFAEIVFSALFCHTYVFRLGLILWVKIWLWHTTVLIGEKITNCCFGTWLPACSVPNAAEKLRRVPLSAEIVLRICSGGLLTAGSGTEQIRSAADTWIWWNGGVCFIIVRRKWNPLLPRWE